MLVYDVIAFSSVYFTRPNGLMLCLLEVEAVGRQLAGGSLVVVNAVWWSW